MFTVYIDKKNYKHRHRVISSDGKNRLCRFKSIRQAESIRTDSTSEHGIFDSVVIEYILYYRRIGTLTVVKPAWLANVCSQESELFLQSTQCHCAMQLPNCFTNQLLHLLANVNSSSCSLYVVDRPSVCLSSVVCLSVVCLSVTFVRPTQAIEIFGTFSSPFGTLAICWHPGKILQRSSHGNPSVGGVKHNKGSRI